MLFVTAEVVSLTSYHEPFLSQLRWIHWHQNRNAFCDSWGRFTDTKARTLFVTAEVDSLSSKHARFLWTYNRIYAVKQLFVMNSVVAGLKFHSFAKKTGKLQFNSDTFIPFKTWTQFGGWHGGRGPHFFRLVVYNMPCPPTFSSLGFVFGEVSKTKLMFVTFCVKSFSC